MIVFAGIVLLAATAAFVAWPFFGRSEFAAGVGSEAGASAHWERQKAEAYAAIRELEFDYRMGKLSDADFNAIRERYAARALDAIAAIEQARSGRAAVAAKSAKGEPARMRFCHVCGRRLPARANFCPACGQDIRSLSRAEV